MAVNGELLRAEEDGTLSFGNYHLSKKSKLDNFEFEGDIYKVKTFQEITKLEKNGLFVYESVPGSRVTKYHATADEVRFALSSFEDVQFTLELEADQEYEVFVHEESVGTMTTNLSGKLNISVELEEDEETWIDVKRIVSK